MAVSLVAITGHVLTPDGSAPTSGRLVVRLSQAGSTLDGSEMVRVATEVTEDLATGGAVSFALVPNDAITPSGTYYLATFVVQLASGRRVQWSEKWQLTSEDLTLDIGAVPRLEVVPGVSLAPYFVPGDASAMVATATGSTEPRMLSTRFADTVNVKDHGAVGDGATDDTAAIQAAIDVLTGATGAGSGGTVFFPTGTYRLDGQILFKNNGAATPSQPNVRLVGSGAHFNGQGGAPRGGTILDMRYSGAVAKLDTRGLGLLEISGITFARLSGTDSTPFIQTTLTTLLCHDAGFYGDTDRTGTQDAIILGGTVSPQDGSADSAFQGYGTVIERCYFNRIRRAVYMRTWCNSAVFTNNCIWAQCGFSTGAAIDIDGGPGGGDQATGNVVSNNLIEMVGYKYGIRIGYGLATSLTNNNFWDPTATTTAYYRIDTGASMTFIVDGWHTTTKPTLDDAAPTVSKTSLLSGILAVPQLIGGGAQFDISSSDLRQTGDGVFATHLVPSSGAETYQRLESTAANPDLAFYLKPNGGSAEQVMVIHYYGVGQSSLRLPGATAAIVEASGGDLKLKAKASSTLWLGDLSSTSLYWQESTKTLVLNNAACKIALGSVSGPTITTGSAAPSAAENDGSIYLRSGAPNGQLYVREAGAWVLK